MALNGLSARGMQDIVKRYVKKELSGRMELVLSKLLTVFWRLDRRICVKSFIVEIRPENFLAADCDDVCLRRLD